MLQLGIDPIFRKTSTGRTAELRQETCSWNPANLQPICDQVKDRATLEKDPNFLKLDPGHTKERSRKNGKL